MENEKNTVEKKHALDEGALFALLKRVRAAQEAFAEYSQERVDEIFRAAAKAANEARIPLARAAVEETGMGVFEDKVLKNHYAAEYMYNRYKDEKTCGVLERDEGSGYARIAAPIGVVAAIVPTTNPTSTAIFKALLCLKTRNGLIFSPHPRAKKCTVEAARIVLDAAVRAGAPEGIIGWIDEPSVEASAWLMREADIILATGGPQMVRAAYSSGKPAIGVGAGNTPAVVDSSADIRAAAASIVHSKTFDNGVICASEQAAVAVDDCYEAFKAELCKSGAYILTEEERVRLGAFAFRDGKLNAAVVGQSARRIAELCGVAVGEDCKLLVGETERVDEDEPFAKEKLSPVLALYRAKDFADAVDIAEALVQGGGMGHTAAVYLNEQTQAEKLQLFCERMKTCRILINTPAAQGGIGDIYNFRLPPSLTLGCGSWGGNSVCENVGVRSLLNVKTVAARRENMLWLRVPERVYFKRGSLRTALRELGKEGYARKHAFIVTDSFLHRSGVVRSVTEALDELGIVHATYDGVTPDPTLACVREAAKRMREFEPDVVIAVGGGSPMDAAKVAWALYEQPNVRFEDMSMRFMDIRKRVCALPKLGNRAIFVAVPTTAGTGSEVTPFAVITDEKTGEKYPLADYELLPTMAISDVELMRDIPRGLTANAGFDALSHAFEAIGSTLASDYTNALAYEAICLLVKYLPRAYERGGEDMEARERVANAATIAGLAFANAFLGVCHSMAHKLGAAWHLPHGVANALLLCEVLRFNAAKIPEKMGTFPQYAYPDGLRRYAEAARRLGVSGADDRASFENLLRTIEDLKARLGLPKTIREALGEGVREEDFLRSIDEMSADAYDDQCTGANPRYPLVEEIKAIYKRAYYGKG